MRSTLHGQRNNRGNRFLRMESYNPSHSRDTESCTRIINVANNRDDRLVGIKPYHPSHALTYGTCARIIDVGETTVMIGSLESNSHHPSHTRDADSAHV